MGVSDLVHLAHYCVNIIKTVHIKNVGRPKQDKIVVSLHAERLNVRVRNKRILIQGFALRVSDHS